MPHIAAGAGLLPWGIKWQDAIIGLVALPALMVALGLAARRGAGAGGPIRFSGPLGVALVRSPVAELTPPRYRSSAALMERSKAPLPNAPSSRAATLPSRSKVKSHGSLRSRNARSCLRRPFSTVLSW